MTLFLSRAYTNPMHYQWIFTKDNENDELLKYQQKFPDRYFNRIIDNKEIIGYDVPGDDLDTQWKFISTDSMILPTLRWFHAILGHSGIHCMHATLQASYHHPHLQTHIELFLCDKCQWTKPTRPGHGFIPDQDITSVPWEEVAVDLIGPWSVSTLHGDMKLFLLTYIDTTTNLVKLTMIFEKSSNHITNILSIPGSLGTLD